MKMDEQRNKEIGRRVKALRDDARMTQAQLGEALGGLSQSTIQRIEAGEAELSVNELVRLTTIFRISLEMLLGQTEVNFKIREHVPSITNGRWTWFEGVKHGKFEPKLEEVTSI